MSIWRRLLTGSFIGRRLLEIPESETRAVLEAPFRWLAGLVARSQSLRLFTVEPALLENTGSLTEAAAETVGRWFGARRPAFSAWRSGSWLGRRPWLNWAPLSLLLLPFLPTVAAVPVVWFFLLVAFSEGRLEAVPYKPLLLGLLVVLLSGGLYGLDRGDSLLNLILWLTNGAAFLFWFAVADRRPERTEGILLLALAGGVIAAALGFHQYQSGLVTPAGWLDPSTNPGIRTRIYSVFGNPDLFGMYLAVLWPYALSLILRSRRPAVRVGATLAGVVLLTALGLTFSRGAWLGLLAGTLFLLLLLRPWTILWVTVLLPLSLLSKTLGGRLGTIVNLGHSHSVLYRQLIWQSTWPIIGRFPLTGLGLGPAAFTLIYPLYQVPGIVAVHTQNIYLQLLVEMGLPGLILVLLLLWQLAAAAFRGWQGSPRALSGAVAVALAAVIISNLIQGTVDDIWYDPHVNLIFWSLAGLSLGLYRRQGASTDANTARHE